MPDLWILKYKASSLLILRMVNMNLQISSGVSHRYAADNNREYPLISTTTYLYKK